MPDPLSLAFEGVAAALLLVCLRHAWARGPARVASLLAGVGYGVLLEYMAIETAHAYAYGRFLVTLFGEVPLCIGVGWGVIIYTAMETSDRYALPWQLRPVLDGLLALAVDLSMDAVAIRVGFWRWAAPGPWFGVPLGNFYVWFVVVLGFSLLVRLARLWWLAGGAAGLANLAVAALAIALAVTGLFALLPWLGGPLTEGASGWACLGALLGGSLLLAAWAARRTPGGRPPDAAVLGVSATFHLFFLAALLWSGAYRAAPALIPLAAATLALDAALHLWPCRRPAVLS